MTIRDYVSAVLLVAMGALCWHLANRPLQVLIVVPPPVAVEALDEPIEQGPIA